MEFKIFLTNLGKYNEGELVGKWVELPCNDFEAELAAIGVDGEEYEEYFITDYECDCEAVEVHEYESLEELNDLAERLQDVDDLDWLAAYMQDSGEDLLDAIDDYEACSMWYKDMDLEELAYQLVEEDYDLPDFAKRYFDYESFAYDLSFEYTEYEGGVLYRY